MMKWVEDAQRMKWAEDARETKGVEEARGTEWIGPVGMLGNKDQKKV